MLIDQQNSSPTRTHAVHATNNTAEICHTPCGRPHQITTTPNSKPIKNGTRLSKEISSLADDYDDFEPTLNERLSLVSKWGGFTLAWSIGVQNGLRYFGNDNALIAFAQKWGNIYVLGDPITSPENMGRLLEQFLAIYPKACFVQCGLETAKLLERHRYYLNEMGVDTSLDLTEYNFAGKQKEHLRYASNWLGRRKFKVVEESGFLTADEQESIAKISAAWRETKTIKHREVAFLNRPLDLETESRSVQHWQTAKGVRRFYLCNPTGQRVAFLFFDPLFEQGEVVGYVTSIKRRLPDSPPLSELGITKHAIESFQKSEVRELRLGLSPLAEIENQDFKTNVFLHHSLRCIYRSRLFNRMIYPLKGHAQFKNRFRGKAEKVYFASRTIINDVRLLGLLRLCRAI